MSVIGIVFAVEEPLPYTAGYWAEHPKTLKKEDWLRPIENIKIGCVVVIETPILLSIVWSRTGGGRLPLFFALSGKPFESQPNFPY